MIIVWRGLSLERGCFVKLFMAVTILCFYFFIFFSFKKSSTHSWAGVRSRDGKTIFLENVSDSLTPTCAYQSR